MNLAELIEEGKRLESKQNSVVALPLQWATLNERRPFYIEHGPRLLAVAEAALKIRKTIDVLEYAGTSPRLSADIAAFDALAARGGE